MRNNNEKGHNKCRSDQNKNIQFENSIYNLKFFSQEIVNSSLDTTEEKLLKQSYFKN